MDTRGKPAYDICICRARSMEWADGGFRGIIVALLTHPESPHANAARQRIRHGLSRYRQRPAASVRARLAVRFPHLVGGARAADATTSGDRGLVAALFSRALGRGR